MPARQRGGALVERRAARSPRSGCSGSSATGSPTRPRSAGTASRSGRKPFSASSGSSTTSWPANARRARRPGSPGVVTATTSPPDAPGRGGRSPPWSRASGRPRSPGRAPTPKRRAHPAPRSPRAARAAPRPPGRSRRGSIAAASARRMNAGVSSRGSPTPKSMTSTPRSASAPLGLGEPHERVGLAGPRGPGSAARERLQERAVAQRTSAAISTDSSRRWAWAGSPGPKLTASMPAARELGDRASTPAWARPRARRRPRSALDERVAVGHRRRRGVGRRSAARRGRRTAPRSRASASSGERPGRVAEVDVAVDRGRGSTLRAMPPRSA